MTFDPLLTPIEHQLLVLYANGADRDQLLDLVKDANHTLKTLTQNICTKLGADTPAHAVAVAFCTDLLSHTDINGFTPARKGARR